MVKPGQAASTSESGYFHSRVCGEGRFLEGPRLVCSKGTRERGEPGPVSGPCFLQVLMPSKSPEQGS